MAQVIQAILLVAAPVVILALVKRVRVLGLIGATLLCYLVGIASANLSIPIDQGVSMQVSQVAVLLAIPLLLYCTDFVRWLKLARSTVLSFLLACVAVMLAATLGWAIFSRYLPQESWKLAGMFVGVYTGGTVNMNAVGYALGVREEIFVMANAADVVMGGIYLIFLMTVAQRVLLKFLPAFKSVGAVAAAETEGGAAGGGPAVGEAYAPTAPTARARWRLVGQVAIAVGVAILIVGASVGLSFLVTGGISETLVLLAITTLGIAASFIPRLRRLEGAPDFGQYLLLVFCVAIGSIADFRVLSGSPVIFGYCALVMTSAVVLHYAMAALFRIDADTVIITSVAAVFSPAFVGPIAGVLKNREIIVSGLTTGLVGYAVGNYLGLALAYLLH